MQKYVFYPSHTNSHTYGLDAFWAGTVPRILDSGCVPHFTPTYCSTLLAIFENFGFHFRLLIPFRTTFFVTKHTSRWFWQWKCKAVAFQLQKSFRWKNTTWLGAKKFSGSCSVSKSHPRNFQTVLHCGRTDGSRSSSRRSRSPKSRWLSTRAVLRRHPNGTANSREKPSRRAKDSVLMDSVGFLYIMKCWHLSLLCATDSTCTYRSALLLISCCWRHAWF